MRNKIYACLFPVRGERKRVVWEITNKCNASCIYCCSSSTSSGHQNELSYNKIIRLIDNLRDSKFTDIYFSGGEPLLKENFLKILSFARKKFQNVIFSTNGFFIDEKIADRIARINPTYVGVSIDSPDPDYHDTQRGIEGLHQRACLAVRLLSERGTKVRINFTISKGNYKYIQNMIKLAYTLGAEAVLFQFFLPVGRGENISNLLLPWEIIVKLTTLFKTLKRYYEKKYSMKILYRRFPKKNAPVEKCPGGEQLIYLTPDGRVGVCPWICKIDSRYLSSSSFYFTNLEGLLEDENIKKFKRFIENRRPENCKSCKIEKCGYGCPVFAYIFNKSFSESDPICKVKK